MKLCGSGNQMCEWFQRFILVAAFFTGFLEMYFLLILNIDYLGFFSLILIFVLGAIGQAGIYFIHNIIGE